MALNKFPTYDALVKEAEKDEDKNGGKNKILKIIEEPIEKGAIMEITGYPGTGKTLVSGMKFNHYNGKKIYLTYANMLLAYTKQGLGIHHSLYTVDKYLYDFGDGKNDIKDDDELDKDKKLYKRRLRRISNLQKSEDTVLFIDEAQDIPAEILARLSLKFNSIVICGDKDQMVYNRFNIGSDYFHEYENRLEKIDPNFQAHYNIRGHNLTKNYRNTKAIFDFAKCFQPESQRVDDVEIMREGGEKPKILLGKAEDIFEKELKTLCINTIGDQEVIGIVTEERKDVELIYEKIKKLLKQEMGESFNDKMIRYYTSDDKKSSREKITECNNCMEANIIISTVKSMKGLEFDTVVIRKVGDTGRSDAPINRSRYYVGITRAKERLIICQEALNFGNYNVNEELYDIKEIKNKDDNLELPF